MHLKGKTGKEKHGQLADVYGSAAPSYAQVKFWVEEFKCGRTSLEEKARSGCPLDAINEEMCKKVQNLAEETAQALGISHGSTLTISHGSTLTTLHDHLGMRKLTARWVPKSLIDEKWQPEHQRESLH